MTKREQRNWKEKGPPTWAATWGILILAVTSYALAGFGVGRFFELIIQATEFWPSVYMIGLGGSYFIRRQGMGETSEEFKRYRDGLSKPNVKVDKVGRVPGSDVVGVDRSGVV